MEHLSSILLLSSGAQRRSPASGSPLRPPWHRRLACGRRDQPGDGAPPATCRRAGHRRRTLSRLCGKD